MINIDEFKNKRVLVIGDLMLDKYVWGDVERISPEAPVPVVNVKEETYTLGGAGNVIKNIVSLGGNVTAIGMIGKDYNGKLLTKELIKLRHNFYNCCLYSDRPTTTKTRVMCSNHQMIRIDNEESKPINSKDQRQLLNAITNHVHKCDIVVLSDYNKGVITREIIYRAALKARLHNKISIVDPKNKNFMIYRDVDIITPNKKEYDEAVNIQNKTILITCGDSGMRLIEPDKPDFNILSNAKQVFDVSGAGDTVVATLALSMASGGTLKESAILSNIAGGLVVSKLGTATISTNELKREYK
jgi:rfaE bifunctional protein kinase chain/domain